MKVQKDDKYIFTSQFVVGHNWADTEPHSGTGQPRADDFATDLPEVRNTGRAREECYMQNQKM